MESAGNVAAKVAPVFKKLRRLLSHEEAAFSGASLCLRREMGRKRYWSPPLLQEEMQLKQSTQREVSTVMFLLSMASALQLRSHKPQCVQLDVSNEMRKSE